jgi:uncharacterized protein (TIGR02186 family)
MLRRLLPALVLAALIPPEPARSERLVTSLSSHQVLIASNFTGTNVVLFGSLERDAASVPRRSGYDIVVTVLGPRQPLVVRVKRRVLGIWANVDSREFMDTPAYIAVLATNPVLSFANAETLRRLQVGLDNISLPQRIGGKVANILGDDPFRVALIRIKHERGLYLEEPKGVTFLTPALFRASIPLPAEVPVGTYDVDVKLFADGAMIARTNSALEIVKVGFEQFVANAARDWGVLYGLATAMMALLTGWFASVAFRRD